MDPLKKMLRNFVLITLGIIVLAFILKSSGPKLEQRMPKQPIQEEEQAVGDQETGQPAP